MFKETLQKIKGYFQNKITAESTPEEVNEVNAFIGDLDSMDVEHDKVITENAKFKDTIVNMVSTQGNSDKPKDESGGSKPMTMDEIIALKLEEQNGGK